MIIPRKVFKEVGGFDEELKVVYNDVDLCLEDSCNKAILSYIRRLRCCTTLNLLLEDACGRPERKSFFVGVGATISELGDPYYNPSLTLTREDWSLRL